MIITVFFVELLQFVVRLPGFVLLRRNIHEESIDGGPLARAPKLLADILAHNINFYK